MAPKLRPHGTITRGKTALNRLRQVDVYVALAYSSVLTGGEPLVVDVGYGARPWTALEMRQRWLRLNSRLRLLGLEIDPQRVEAAAPLADPPAVEFRLGGFNLADVLGGRAARVVRCYNVLRQYDEAEVAAALAAMAAGIEEGGLLVEGTSNPSGSMVAFDCYRIVGGLPVHDALVFGTNFRSPRSPVDFQTIAPKRLIHRMRDKAPERFFAEWRRAVELVRGRGIVGAREQWVAVARELKASGRDIDVRARIVERGFLVARESLS